MNKASIIGGFLVAVSLAAFLVFKFGLTTHHELTGTVLGFAIGDDTVIIDHSEIPGYMPAMTMPFYDSQNVFSDFVVGDSISFELVVRGNESWVENPSFISKSQRDDLAVSPLPSEQIDQMTPEAQLIDEEGIPFKLTDRIDQGLLFTFIYTRCPIPDFCPLMSSNFQEIDEANIGIPLLSISIDPEFDSPQVLMEYAKAYKSAESEWTFATGERSDIDRFASYFGIQYAQDTDELIHNLVTVYVNQDGVVKKIWRGNRWDPKDLISELKKLN